MWWEWRGDSGVDNDNFSVGGGDGDALESHEVFFPPPAVRNLSGHTRGDTGRPQPTLPMKDEGRLKEK